MVFCYSVRNVENSCFLIDNLLQITYDAAYLHHWLSVTIHFNRYNLRFYKYTECRDKCKPLYFIVLHIRVVPPSFSHFVECPLSDSNVLNDRAFPHGCYRTLVECKGNVFLGISVICGGIFALQSLTRWKKCCELELFARKSVIVSVCPLEKCL